MKDKVLIHVHSRSLSSFESLDSDSSKSYQRKSIGASNIQSLDELMSSISCKYDIEEIENAITKEIFKTTLSKKLVIRGIRKIIIKVFV